MKLLKFAIGIITFYPDNSVLNRIDQYRKIADYIFIFDNSVEENNISRKLKENYTGYINYSRNLGLSAAMNYFYDECLNKEVDILLTMDQDSVFLRAQIKKMIEQIIEENDNEYGIYCPNYRKLYLDKNLGDVPSEFKISEKEDKDVAFSMTSGSFYKIEMLKSVFPLQDLFIGYVDHELSFRVIQLGKKIKMVGNVSFDQQVGEKMVNNIFNKTFRVIRHKPERYRYMCRNNFFLQQEFKSKKKLTIMLKKDIIRLIFNIIIGEKNKINKLKNMYFGYNDFKNGKLGQLEESAS